MLGLKKGTVKIFPHNPKWKGLFEKEKKFLVKKLGNFFVDVQHMGSTSVPGMHAKPILDIGVAVNTVKDFSKFTKILEKAGYIQVTTKNKPHLHLVFTKRSKGKITEFLHLVKHKGVIWNGYMSFRDILINNKTIANRYVKLKKKLALRHPNDRMKYTESKAKFVMGIIKKAGR